MILARMLATLVVRCSIEEIGDRLETVSIIMGGIGLFLLGMVLMTDGLKAVAGNSLKDRLSRLTGGVLRSVISGATVTAIVQSSSATILMTIGFVSAGLITFTQSIGVILGANLGSTSTGWLVSLIGLKVSVTSFALPLIGIGALLKFFTNGKYSYQGMVLAGFGLIFLGIGTLQDGMAGIAENFSLQSFIGDSFFQLLLLIIIGLVMTVVMQSSSTAMVITLTALAADALSFEHAAMLVVGQNIGTTVKAYFATIGGTVQTKRTAMTHIMFNIIVAFIALLLFPLILGFIGWLERFVNYSDQAISLAVFSTLIYILGIIGLLPFLSFFIKIITRIVPEKGDKLTKYLDSSVATVPAVAIEAVRRTLIRVSKAISRAGIEVFDKRVISTVLKNQFIEANAAINETRNFLSQVGSNTSSRTELEYHQQVALIHTIDHLERLLKALEESDYLEHLHKDDMILALSDDMCNLFADILDKLSYDRNENLVYKVKINSLAIADLRRKSRKEIIEKTVLRQSDVDATIQKVHTLHWIDRVAFHLWRSMHHLDKCFESEIVAESER
ncbi:Na/Pi cotransporter family protein [Calidifontibacillus oryziterrae]|uniref:Na/Pi cotransporter family protein n=1 Tax=Calidifontibacillus oryziterrae TaxID=1191699 RepID=UPI00031C72AF|nr:Na/Pi symporter [Calidifontibacillus oryziterrae]